MIFGDLTPIHLLIIGVGLVVSEPQENNRGREKNPPVSGKPHGHGETSQAETGQEQGKLSTKGISKGRGDGAAAGKFFFHIFILLNCLILLSGAPFPEACMALFLECHMIAG